MVGFVSTWVFLFFVAGVGIFFAGQLSVREEGDPAAVGRPLGFGIVARLGELKERWCFGVVAVEPQIVAKDLQIPVGAFDSNDDGVAIGRDGQTGIGHGVEEFVESELGLGLGAGLCRNEKCRDEKRDEHVQNF